MYFIVSSTLYNILWLITISHLFKSVVDGSRTLAFLLRDSTLKVFGVGVDAHSVNATDLFLTILVVLLALNDFLDLCDLLFRSATFALLLGDRAWRRVQPGMSSREHELSPAAEAGLVATTTPFSSASASRTHRLVLVHFSAAWFLNSRVGYRASCPLLARHNPHVSCSVFSCFRSCPWHSGRLRGSPVNETKWNMMLVVKQITFVHPHAQTFIHERSSHACTHAHTQFLWVWLIVNFSV